MVVIIGFVVFYLLLFLIAFPNVLVVLLVAKILRGYFKYKFLSIILMVKKEHQD